MKNIGVSVISHARLCAAFVLLTVGLAMATGGAGRAGDSLGTALAQGSGEWAISQAQQAVRQQIINQEGRQGQEGRRERLRNPVVRFNADAQTESVSNNAVRVRGTGVFLRNNDSRYDNSRYDNSRYDNSRNNDGRSRDFTYEAIVNNRNRNRNNSGNVSGIRYDMRNGWSGNSGGQGDNNSGYGNAARPNGRVSYSGAIMNRRSDKGLDVAEQSMQDGANIQQWGYADQPNQNWDVIDLGNGEVAIISRHSGKAITAQGGRGNNGTNIVQRTWNDSRQQRWRLEQVGGDYYRIVSVDNGKCLDVTEQGRQDGANIQLWDYADQANQQWRLRR